MPELLTLAPGVEVPRPEDGAVLRYSQEAVQDVLDFFSLLCFTYKIQFLHTGQMGKLTITYQTSFVSIFSCALSLRQQSTWLSDNSCNGSCRADYFKIRANGNRFHGIQGNPSSYGIRNAYPIIVYFGKPFFQ